MNDLHVDMLLDIEWILLDHLHLYLYKENVLNHHDYMQIQVIEDLCELLHYEHEQRQEPE